MNFRQVQVGDDRAVTFEAAKIPCPFGRLACDTLCAAYHESFKAFEPYGLGFGPTGAVQDGQARGEKYANCLQGRFTIGRLK